MRANPRDGRRHRLQHVAWQLASPCVDQVGDDYLLNRVLPEADVSCPFVIPS